jgi:hypothetical protein
MVSIYIHSEIAEKINNIIKIYLWEYKYDFLFCFMKNKNRML